MDRIPKQEDIFSKYDRKYSVAVGVPEPTVAPSVIDFPKFEQPEPQTKKEEQTPITVPQHVDVGSKTFNVNDLIQKGLYDAAEYFLGRPLTAAERSSGLGERTARHDASKDVRDSELLNKVDLLVQASVEQLAVLKAAAGPKKDDKKDDDEEHDAVRSFDGEEKEDPFEDEALAQRFIDLYGEDEFDVQSHTDQSEWTKDFIDRYNALKRAKVPAGQPQGGKAKVDPAKLYPDYNPDKSYIIADANALLDKWRSENPKIKAVPNNYLFRAKPSKKADLQTRLKDAYQEIIKFRQAEQAEMDPTDNLVAAVLGTPVRGQLTPAQKKILQNLNEVEEGRALDFGQVGHGTRRGAKGFNWTPFGRWSIARDQLENDDVVSIRHLDGHTKVARFPNKTVSAAMKVCLLQALDGKPVSDTLLTGDEKEWLDNLLHDANVKRIKKQPDKLKLRKTPGQIKERISVLMGEIAMGDNDNPLLKKELKGLYQQAVMRDLLSEHKQDILKDFISGF